MPAFWHLVRCGWKRSHLRFGCWSGADQMGRKNRVHRNVADDEVLGHRWTGDLEGMDNPAPKWWLYLYFRHDRAWGRLPYMIGPYSGA